MDLFWASAQTSPTAHLYGISNAERFTSALWILQMQRRPLLTPARNEYTPINMREHFFGFCRIGSISVVVHMALIFLSYSGKHLNPWNCRDVLKCRYYAILMVPNFVLGVHNNKVWSKIQSLLSASILCSDWSNGLVCWDCYFLQCVFETKFPLPYTNFSSGGFLRVRNTVIWRVKTSLYFTVHFSSFWSACKVDSQHWKHGG